MILEAKSLKELLKSSRECLVLLLQGHGLYGEGDIQHVSFPFDDEALNGGIHFIFLLT